MVTPGMIAHEAGQLLVGRIVGTRDHFRLDHIVGDQVRGHSPDEPDARDHGGQVVIRAGTRE